MQVQDKVKNYRGSEAEFGGVDQAWLSTGAEVFIGRKIIQFHSLTTISHEWYFI